MVKSAICYSFEEFEISEIFELSENLHKVERTGCMICMLLSNKDTMIILDLNLTILKRINFKNSPEFFSLLDLCFLDVLNYCLPSATTKVLMKVRTKDGIEVCKILNNVISNVTTTIFTCSCCCVICVPKKATIIYAA